MRAPKAQKAPAAAEMKDPARRKAETKTGKKMELIDKLRGGIDAATMKKIAIITMFIDHLTLSFLEVPTNENHVRIMYSFPAGEMLDQIGRGIGRLAFPIFCFLIVEGFIHTRDRLNYLIRLLIFAAIAHVPFNLMAFPYSGRRHTDTIFTLAAGYVVIWCITELSRLLPEKYRPVPQAVRSRGGNTAVSGGAAGGADTAVAGESNTAAGEVNAAVAGEGSQEADTALVKLPAVIDNLAVRAILFLVPSAILTYGICRLVKWAGCDYTYGGVLCILILYLFYRARDFSLVAAWLWLTYYNHSELLALTGFFLIRCYNGKRGKQSKYFFYLFYPGHLMFLYLLRMAIWGM